jgi:hypothetical protein
MNRYDESIVTDLYPLREGLRKLLTVNHPEHVGFMGLAIVLINKIDGKIKEFEGEDE